LTQQARFSAAAPSIGSLPQSSIRSGGRSLERLNLPLSDVDRSTQHVLLAQYNTRTRAATCPPSVAFDESASDDLKAVVPHVLNGLKLNFPNGYSNLEIKSSTSETDHGSTITSRRGTATIDVPQASEAENESPVDRQGKYAQTFLHELFLHAAPDLQAHGEGRSPTSQDMQHRSMYDPANDNNRFLHAVRGVLRELPDDNMRLSFLGAYVEDVNDRFEDAGGSNPTVESWIETLMDAATNLDHSMWNLHT
jgi:Lhr-like helicase